MKKKLKWDWPAFATADELARYNEILSERASMAKEVKLIRSRCTHRARQAAAQANTQGEQS